MLTIKKEKYKGYVIRGGGDYHYITYHKYTINPEDFCYLTRDGKMINRNKISGFDSKFIKNASIFYFKSIKEAKETIDLYLRNLEFISKEEMEIN